jgi:hypothetical protein
VNLEMNRLVAVYLLPAFLIVAVSSSAPCVFFGFLRCGLATPHHSRDELLSRGAEWVEKRSASA